MNQEHAQPLMGYTGQAPIVVLADGSELQAGDLVDRAFDKFRRQNAATNGPLLSADDWNDLPEDFRASWCSEIVDDLNAAIAANAAAADATNVLGTIGHQVARNLFEDLIDACLTEVKQMAKPWPGMSESEQRDTLERITNRVKHAGAQLIRDLATKMHPAYTCDLKQVTVKKDAQIVLEIAKGAIDQDLLDAVGGPILLVVASLDDVKAVKAPEPEPDQGDLLLQVGGSAPNISDDGNGTGEADPGTVVHSDPED
jgi:hypothetical protein